MKRIIKQICMMALIIAVSISTAVYAESYYGEMGKAVGKQKPRGSSTGIHTFDPVNTINGLINVEAVFDVFHHNEEVRDLDTRLCGEIGVSELASGSRSTGEYCCNELWEVEGKYLMSAPGMKKHMGGNLGGRDEKGKNKLKNRAQFMDYCCKLSDDKRNGDFWVFCQTDADEKAGCVKDKLHGGDSDLETVMAACNVTCDPKYYGTLKHNKDGEYEDEQIEELMKTCADEEIKWAPSTTVPGASEFAPAVPENLKATLVQGGKKDE